MPKKPAKYGLKYNCIVDVATSYLLDSNIYTGKSSIEAKNETNVVEKIVLKL
jgi:hypothetical protein